MKIPDRFAFALGVASVASTIFVVTRGDPWQMVKMTGQTAVVAVVLGVLAALAGRLGRPLMQVAVGGAFLLAALVVLVELASGRSLTGGRASTFALWLGLGIGLVAAGRTPREEK